MRDQAIAEKNIVDTLKSFDSRGKETVLRRPVPMEKLIEVWKKSQDLQGIPTFRREISSNKKIKGRKEKDIEAWRKKGQKASHAHWWRDFL